MSLTLTRKNKITRDAKKHIFSDSVSAFLKNNAVFLIAAVLALITTIIIPPVKTPRLVE